MKTLVIVNPASGGGRSQKLAGPLATFLREQGLQADFVHARSAQHLRNSAAEACQMGYGTAVALGGDGTFLHVLNGAFGHDLTLGILPAGGANDIATELGIPRDAFAAARLLFTGSARRIDVVRARFGDGRTELYAGVGGMGLDAEAAHLASEKFRSLPGATRYLAGAFWALAKFQPLALQAELDGEYVRGEVLFAAVANTRRYGGGLRIAPAALPDDGWLDVALVGPLPWTRLLEAVPVLLQTGDVRWPEIRRMRARHVRLHADRPAIFHGDGEVLGDGPVELEVVPKAIRILV